jgi:hypothetical protein
MRFLQRFMKSMSQASRTKYHNDVYVRCKKCGEVLKARIDLRNDLSIRYGEGGESDHYFTRKTIIGSKGCYAPIEIELKFDDKRELLDQTIQGGEFLTEDEYQQGLQDKLAKK